MANIFDYFNGSKFYRKRTKYQSEYFANAKAIIDKYKLRVKYLEPTTTTRTLTIEEVLELINDPKPSKDRLRAKALSGTTGKTYFGAITQDGVVKIKSELEILGNDMVGANLLRTDLRGLRTFTNIKAEQDARLETHYVMDKFPKQKVAGWLAGLALSIALAATPFMQAVGLSMKAAIISSILLAIADFINTMVKLINDTQLTALNYKVESANIVLDLTQKANYALRNKNLSAGELARKDSYANFANGSNYLGGSAGSESFSPTLVYNPSTHILAQNGGEVGKAIIKADYATTDERTQGRAQYNLAGNDGYMQQNFPNLQLARIDNLKPDFEYKLNAYKNKQEDLLRYYSELSKWLSSDEDNNAAEWIQAVFDDDVGFYRDVLYDYIESKSFINELRSYPSATRFKGEFFSRVNATREAKKESISVENIPQTPPAIEVEEDNPDTKETLDFLSAYEWVRYQTIQAGGNADTDIDYERVASLQESQQWAQAQEWFYTTRADSELILALWVWEILVENYAELAQYHADIITKFNVDFVLLNLIKEEAQPVITPPFMQLEISFLEYLGDTLSQNKGFFNVLSWIYVNLRVQDLQSQMKEQLLTHLPADRKECMLTEIERVLVQQII